MKGVQCYELFGGIALKNHAFSFLKKWQENNESFHSPLKYSRPKFQFCGGDWKIGSLKCGDLDKKVKNPCCRRRNRIIRK